jgi:hypothetical protein
MQRHTRSGAQYYPAWEDFSFLKTDEYKVHQTDVSLEELLAAAEDAAEVRAQALEDLELDPEDSGSEWEDVDSRPPSPDFDSRPSSDFDSRPPSPETPATSVASNHLVDPDMPPLINSALRRAARQAQYQRRRRQAKRQKQASSPFTRRVHPKSLPTHRMLPTLTSDFDAHNFETTKGGHWLGKPHRQSTKKGRSNALRLRTLKELLSLGFKYITWDGK